MDECSIISGSYRGVPDIMLVHVPLISYPLLNFGFRPVSKDSFHCSENYCWSNSDYILIVAHHCLPCVNCHGNIRQGLHPPVNDFRRWITIPWHCMPEHSTACSWPGDDNVVCRFSSWRNPKQSSAINGQQISIGCCHPWVLHITWWRRLNQKIQINRIPREGLGLAVGAVIDDFTKHARF